MSYFLFLDLVSVSWLRVEFAMGDYIKKKVPWEISEFAPTLLTFHPYYYSFTNKFLLLRVAMFAI